MEREGWIRQKFGEGVITKTHCLKFSKNLKKYLWKKVGEGKGKEKGCNYILKNKRNNKHTQEKAIFFTNLMANVLLYCMLHYSFYSLFTLIMLLIN